MDINEIYLKELQKDQLYNQGNLKEKMRVLAEDKGYMNKNPYEINGAELPDTTVTQKLTQPEYAQHPKQGFEVNDITDYINNHPWESAGIAGAGLMGAGLIGRSLGGRRKIAEASHWEDGFTEHELEKIANNVPRIVNDHFDSKERRENGKGRYSEEKANKYFNMSDSSREKYKAMKKKQDNAYRNLFTVDRAVNAFNTSKDKKETEYAKDLILKNTGRIGATIPIKKNWLGQVTRYGISPGVVNNVK